VPQIFVVSFHQVQSSFNFDISSLHRLGDEFRRGFYQFLYLIALSVLPLKGGVAQWVEHLTCNGSVVRSSPIKGYHCFL